jgi:opacity protein-like surface antigen
MRTFMKKVLLISTAFAALIAPTIAAAKQLRVYKRPVPVAAPVSTWTGFYVGANLGGSWSNVRTNIAGSASTVALPGVGGGFPGNNVAFADFKHVTAKWRHRRGSDRLQLSIQSEMGVGLRGRHSGLG